MRPAKAHLTGYSQMLDFTELHVCKYSLCRITSYVGTYNTYTPTLAIGLGLSPPTCMGMDQGIQTTSSRGGRNLELVETPKTWSLVFLVSLQFHRWHNRLILGPYTLSELDPEVIMFALNIILLTNLIERNSNDINSVISSYTAARLY